MLGGKSGISNSYRVQVTSNVKRKSFLFPVSYPATYVLKSTFDKMARGKKPAANYEDVEAEDPLSSQENSTQSQWDSKMRNVLTNMTKSVGVASI
jgi:hypothetical protein